MAGYSGTGAAPADHAGRRALDRLAETVLRYADGSRRERVRGYALAHGRVDVKVCAIDDTWSGLKHVIRTTDR